MTRYPHRYPKDRSDHKQRPESRVQQIASLPANTSHSFPAASSECALPDVFTEYGLPDTSHIKNPRRTGAQPSSRSLETKRVLRETTSRLRAGIDSFEVMGCDPNANPKTKSAHQGGENERMNKLPPLPADLSYAPLASALLRI